MKGIGSSAFTKARYFHEKANSLATQGAVAMASGTFIFLSALFQYSVDNDLVALTLGASSPIVFGMGVVLRKAGDNDTRFAANFDRLSQPPLQESCNTGLLAAAEGTQAAFDHRCKQEMKKLRKNKKL